jgi:RNA polymerase-associated protein RTF1
MEMETSDEEEEDGQISKLEQEEERDRKMFAKLNPEAEPATLEDFERCRISRDLLAKHCLTPWFEDYVKGIIIISLCTCLQQLTCNKALGFGT